MCACACACARACACRHAQDTHSTRVMSTTSARRLQACVHGRGLPHTDQLAAHTSNRHQPPAEREGGSRLPCHLCRGPTQAGVAAQWCVPRCRGRSPAAAQPWAATGPADTVVVWRVAHMWCNEGNLSLVEDRKAARARHADTKGAAEAAPSAAGAAAAGVHAAARTCASAACRTTSRCSAALTSGAAGKWSSRDSASEGSISQATATKSFHTPCARASVRTSTRVGGTQREGGRGAPVQGGQPAAHAAGQQTHGCATHMACAPRARTGVGACGAAAAASPAAPRLGARLGGTHAHPQQRCTGKAPHDTHTHTAWPLAQRRRASHQTQQASVAAAHACASCAAPRPAPEQHSPRAWCAPRLRVSGAPPTPAGA
jgi:hypothetical protein